MARHPANRMRLPMVRSIGHAASCLFTHCGNCQGRIQTVAGGYAMSFSAISSPDELDFLNLLLSAIPDASLFRERPRDIHEELLSSIAR
jgi:hypothetical protein